MKPFYDVGLHVGEVVDQALGEAKTGTPQFLLMVRILGTPLDDGSYTPHKQQYTRTVYMALTDKTMQYVVPRLKALGFTGTSLAQLDPGNSGFQDLTKTQVDLWCSHKENENGELAEKWNISSGAKPLEATPINPKKLRQLDALFGKALKENAAVPKKEGFEFNQEPQHGDPGPPDVEYGNMEISDDDIPF